MKRLDGFVKDLKDNTGEDLICTLMLDEIYIKKEVYWDQSKFEYAGYPTYESVTQKDAKKSKKKSEWTRKDKRTKKLRRDGEQQQ